MKIWKTRRIEKAIGFKLTKWQKDFIFKGKPYGEDIANTRANGKTTAHCLRVCFSKGATLYAIASDPDIKQYMGEDVAYPSRRGFYIYELRKIYSKLQQAKIKGLRDIRFSIQF